LELDAELVEGLGHGKRGRCGIENEIGVGMDNGQRSAASM
jgi:hypothetical protein